MNIVELREKSPEDLKKELLELNKVSFGLRMQLSSGQLAKTSEVKKIKREIARIKTVLTEKGVAV
ncbi:MAG: 50S ribosomal protein L29 [Neisseriaceae bacterium]|nr:50S ribosomal protein L29 [Neisseriaceae bacterium]MCV2509371.1 50S ribosomal protein L29 [Neisseriaceae bacterium]